MIFDLDIPCVVGIRSPSAHQVFTQLACEACPFRHQASRAGCRQRSSSAGDEFLRRNFSSAGAASHRPQACLHSRQQEQRLSVESFPCVAPWPSMCPGSPAPTCLPRPRRARSLHSHHALPHASIALSAPSARPAAARHRHRHRHRRYRRCCRRPLRGFGSVSRKTGTASRPCQALRARC